MGDGGAPVEAGVICDPGEGGGATGGRIVGLSEREGPRGVTEAPGTVEAGVMVEELDGRVGFDGVDGP